MIIDLDMIVGRNGAALPLGILVALARKPFQRRPVETGKEIVAALFQMLHHLRVDLRHAVANGVVQLDQGKEAFFNSCCTRPVDAATPVHAAAGSRDLGLSRSAEKILRHVAEGLQNLGFLELTKIGIAAAVERDRA
jgi:hypothetical protein